MRTATSNEGSSDNADWEAAKNAELRSSIRQACDGDMNLADVWPTITRVGPRPGTEICTIEWRETRAGEATLRRVRVAPSGHVREALPELHGKGGACGWHRRGACGLHRQNEIHAGVDSVVSKNLADNRVALPGDTRAAPPGGVWVAPPGRVRAAPLKLDRLIVRVLPVHNEGCHGTKLD